LALHGGARHRDIHACDLAGRARLRLLHQSGPAPGRDREARFWPGQWPTLIVQGTGNSCTSAADFKHWTLVMQGPKANYSLFGDLRTTSP
jgi:hypothetical protein